MPSPLIIASVVGVLAVAMFVRSAFGFGHGALATPLLALLIDLKLAIPVLAAVSFLVGLWILSRDWRDIHFKGTTQLIVGGLVGTPLGVATLYYVDQKWLLLGLCVFLAFVSVRGLARFELPELRTDRYALAAGVFCGFVGGAINVSGVPAAIYCTMRRWPRQQVRSSLTGFFFATGIASLVGYGVSGLYTGPFWPLCAWSIGPAFLANWLGKQANVRMSKQTFETAIWSLILLTVLIVLGQQVWIGLSAPRSLP